MSLRVRFVLSLLLVLLVGMAMAGGFAWRTTAGVYQQTYAQSLLAQAKLLAQQVANEGVAGENFAVSQSANTMPGFHSRLLNVENAALLSLDPISTDTALIQQSELLQGSDVLQRAEIQLARAGSANTRVRTVAKRQVLYAAAPVLQDNRVVAVVYIATPLPNGIPPEVLWQIVAGVVVAGGGAALLGSWLARPFLRPILQLHHATQTIQARHTHFQLQDTTHIPEYSQLFHAFNQMTRAFWQNEQVQKDFLADVAHELRTPLTVIKGTAETLEDGAWDDAVGRAPLVANLLRESERLIHLVNDLLLLARADARSLQEAPQSFELGDLLRQRCAHFYHWEAHKMLEWQIETPQDCWAWGLPVRTAQVADNLLQNAIRHSPQQGKIEIKTWLLDQQAFFSVSDGGVGIPADALEKVFDRFYRVERSRSRDSGGSGLGLAISRAWVLAQGGSIAVANRPAGGACFTVSLPIATTLPLARHPSDTQE
ncbi:MAG TPA: HAMP domain-containing sensor histidine kinase [Anaerolineales bacterium]|nr:HAMP domain-containing sensor histidine kinase [Anaerolineales bacterium]